MKNGEALKTERLHEPRVGILWWFCDHLLVAGIRARCATTYGGYGIYERGHAEQWQEWQQCGVVPVDVEYDEFPRGRISFHHREGKFLLLADSCIVADQNRLGRVMTVMRLPRENTVTGTDLHYRCSPCLSTQLLADVHGAPG